MQSENDSQPYHTSPHALCSIQLLTLCTILSAFLCNFSLKFLHPGSSWNSNPSVTKGLKDAMTPSPEPDQPSPQSVPPTHFTVTLRSMPWYPLLFSKQNSACIHHFPTHVKCHICITFFVHHYFCLCCSCSITIRNPPMTHVG